MIVNDSTLTRTVLESVYQCQGGSFYFRYRFWVAVHVGNKRICISYIVAGSSGHLQQAEIQIWSSQTSLLRLKGTNQYQLSFWSLPQSLFKCSYLKTASDLNYGSTVYEERISFRKPKSLWHFWVKSQVLYSIGKVIRSSHTSCNISAINVRDLSPRSQIHSALT